MAARTEDHPMEYLDFEGVIPKGEYGGGDVIVWDIGTWEPEDGTPGNATPEDGTRADGKREPGHGKREPGDATPDPAKALAAGELKFVLHGERLSGRWVIVRTSGRGRQAAGHDSGQDQWLLIHKHDETADPDWDIDAFPTSVLSGRTNDQVKDGVPAIWDSSKPPAEALIDLSGARSRLPSPASSRRCSRPRSTPRSATTTGCSR